MPAKSPKRSGVQRCTNPTSFGTRRPRLCSHAPEDLARPIAAKELCLLEHRLSGFFLFVWRVAVFAENAFDGDADFRAHGFALGPVNRDAVADRFDKLVSNRRERRF